MWQKSEWTVVLAPVARMEARGLTKQMLTSGRQVTLVAIRAQMERLKCASNE